MNAFQILPLVYLSEGSQISQGFEHEYRGE